MTLLTDVSSWIYAYRIPVELHGVGDEGVRRITDWCLVKVGKTAVANGTGYRGIPQRIYTELSDMRTRIKPQVPATSAKTTRLEELQWAVSFCTPDNVDRGDMLFFCAAPVAAEEHLRHALGYPLGATRPTSMWAWLFGACEVIKSQTKNPIKAKTGNITWPGGEVKGAEGDPGENGEGVSDSEGNDGSEDGNGVSDSKYGSDNSGSLREAVTLKGPVQSLSLKTRYVLKNSSKLGSTEWVLCPSAAFDLLRARFFDGEFGGVRPYPVSDMYKQLWSLTWGDRSTQQAVGHLQRDLKQLRIVAERQGEPKPRYLDIPWDEIFVGKKFGSGGLRVRYFDLLQRDPETLSSYQNAMKVPGLNMGSRTATSMHTPPRPRQAAARPPNSAPPAGASHSSRT